MGLDPISVAAADLFHQAGQLAVGDVDATAATGADEMVVVLGRIAQDVGVRAVRQVQALDDAQAGKQLQGSEYRGPTYLGLPQPCPAQEIRGREVSPGARDEIGHQPPIRGGLVARVLKCLDYASGLIHSNP